MYVLKTNGYRLLKTRFNLQLNGKRPQEYGNNDGKRKIMKNAKRKREEHGITERNRSRGKWSDFVANL
jgi:hypothetical protein